MKMKALLIIPLIMVHFFAVGQKFALLSTKSKEPILYTDSVTVEQVKTGYFPVETKKVDSFLANLLYLKNMTNSGKNGMRLKMQSFQLISGSTKFYIERVPFAYGDRFKMTGVTQAGEVKAVFNLSDGEVSNNKMGKKIDNIIAYITNNKSFYELKYREINPKEYQVIVRSE